MNNNVDLNTIKRESRPVTSKKMNIKGTVSNMDVYRIPLDMLYYNDQNDRIATWISQYEAENGDIKQLSVEDRNKKIEDYIIKSDKQRFKETMNNIRNFSQLQPGVVFIDGRVIDGNRRFTCLRRLFEETGDSRFGYFEAVILDNDITEKEIKLMELVLQHGEEGKVDYNPIEKLVGIYRDIIQKKLFTVKEYANSISVNEKDVEKSVQLAELMEEFLEYINAPEQFYIARALEIDGPLNEVYSIKKRIGSDEDKWEKVKITLFDNMLMKAKNGESADITRNIREFGKRVVTDDEMFDKYYEKHEPLSRELNQKLNNCPGTVDIDYIRDEIRNNDELSEKINNNMSDIIYEAKKSSIKRQPIEIVSSLISDISKIDVVGVSRLSGEDREEFNNELNVLKEKIKSIEEKINELI